MVFPKSDAFNKINHITNVAVGILLLNANPIVELLWLRSEFDK